MSQIFKLAAQSDKVKRSKSWFLVEKRADNVRVLLISNYLADEQHSMLRYSELLSRLLSAEVDVRTARPRMVFARMSGRRLRKWLAYVDKFIVFPFEMYFLSRQVDLVHICDQGNGIYALCPLKVPCIITCHDVTEIMAARGIFSEHRVRPTGRIFQFLNHLGLTKAKRVICVSAATAERLIALGGLSKERVVVIENGLNLDFRPIDPERAWATLASCGLRKGEQFLLHIGGNQWYKNRIGLVRIFDLVRKYRDCSHLRLVLAGKPLSAELRQEILRLNLGDKVHELVDIDNDTLMALYSAAQALVFPSLQEGYGWPIAEAQACGCPVFASNVEPLPSIGGEAGRYFDPRNVTEAAGIILTGMKELDVMRKKGSSNANRFSPAKMAMEYAKQYRLSAAEGMSLDRTSLG